MKEPPQIPLAPEVPFDSQGQEMSPVAGDGEGQGSKMTNQSGKGNQVADAGVLDSQGSAKASDGAAGRTKKSS